MYMIRKISTWRQYTAAGEGFFQDFPDRPDDFLTAFYIIFALKLFKKNQTK